MVKTLIVAAVLALLAGCASAPSDYCALAWPFRMNQAAWDAADLELKRDIVAHNKLGAELCGWVP